MYARTYRRRIFVSAWPISLIATASDTPPASGSVAAPCRSPWKVIPANPCVAANLRQPVENDARTRVPRSRCRRRAPGAVRSRVTSWLGQRGGAGVPSSRRPGARDPARQLTTLADRSGSRRLRRSASALHARHRPRRPSRAPALPRVGARARAPGGRRRPTEPLPGPPRGSPSLSEHRSRRTSACPPQNSSRAAPRRLIGRLALRSLYDHRKEARARHSLNKHGPVSA